MNVKLFISFVYTIVQIQERGIISLQTLVNWLTAKDDAAAATVVVVVVVVVNVGGCC